MKLVKPVFNPVIIAVVVVLSGCSGLMVKGKGGVTHHIIIGLGVVSVHDMDKKDSLTAVRSHVLGIKVNTGIRTGFIAGYAYAATVVIPDAVRDTCAEISQVPFGRLNIETCHGSKPDLNDKEDSDGNINQ